MLEEYYSFRDIYNKIKTALILPVGTSAIIDLINIHNDWQNRGADSILIIRTISVVVKGWIVYDLLSGVNIKVIG
jgi:hypothetical protein